MNNHFTKVHVHENNAECLSKSEDPNLHFIGCNNILNNLLSHSFSTLGSVTHTKKNKNKKNPRNLVQNAVTGNKFIKVQVYKVF